MKIIGLLSDTHGFINDRLFSFFEKVDEIWHAGDIGSLEASERLSEFRKFRAVYGNIDGSVLRNLYPKDLRFRCEDTDVWITHIGGYPGHYIKEVIKELTIQPPDLLITGHSHILKVIYDKKFNLLYLNPGAAGLYGFHKISTAMRFIISGNEIRNLEIWEFPRKNQILT